MLNCNLSATKRAKIDEEARWVALWQHRPDGDWLMSLIEDEARNLCRFLIRHGYGPEDA